MPGSVTVANPCPSDRRKLHQDQSKRQLYSDSITLAQGVSQGRITSTVNYKSYIDPLLRLLSDAGIGVSAGPLFIIIIIYLNKSTEVT